MGSTPEVNHSIPCSLSLSNYTAFTIIHLALGVRFPKTENFDAMQCPP